MLFQTLQKEFSFYTLMGARKNPLKPIKSTDILRRSVLHSDDYALLLIDVRTFVNKGNDSEQYA
jgi:hypothetical protein